MTNKIYISIAIILFVMMPFSLLRAVVMAAAGNSKAA